MSDKSSVSLLLSVYDEDKAPRSRSKIQRRFEQVDLTKEFEIRTKKREAEKQEKLEELYKKHDQRAEKARELISIDKDVPAAETETQRAMEAQA